MRKYYNWQNSVYTMNKFQFIKQLVDTKKFTPSQKERFLQLVSSELSIVEGRDIKILEDIRLIKEQLGLDDHIIEVKVEDFDDDSNILSDGDKRELFTDHVSSSPNKQADNSDYEKLLIKAIPVNKTLINSPEHTAIIHHPKKLVKLLNKFSENGNALKYATHSWEMGQGNGMYENIEDFLIRLNEAWKEISWDIKELKEVLSSKIYAFLLNTRVKEKGWGVHRLKFGWSSPDLLVELREQGLSDPSLIQLPDYAREHLRLNNKATTIQRFDQVIQIFKNEIEFKDDQPYFEDLIIELHDLYLSNNFNLNDVRNLEKANFYTDTDYFRKAMIKILDGIQVRPNHSQVSYILEYENPEFYIFKIIHHNSRALHKSIKDSKFNLEKGDFGDIKNYLLNLCDWSIESTFIEGNYRLNFLSSIPDTPKEEVLSADAEGFTHILKFYKS